MTPSITKLTTALSDRYRIERELGQGGMATVYLARDLRHDRDVYALGAMTYEMLLGEPPTSASGPPEESVGWPSLLGLPNVVTSDYIEACEPLGCENSRPT